LADLISRNHQPGLNGGAKATIVEAIHAQNDRSSEQNITKLLRESITAGQLLSDQRVVQKGSEQWLQSNAVQLEITQGGIEPNTLGSTSSLSIL